MKRKRLGNVIRGSLLEGLEMKLAPDVSLERVKAGKFLVVEGEEYDFFSIITDLRLAATNEQLLSNPPNFSNDLLRAVISGTGTYAVVSLRPMLMFERAARKNGEPLEPEPVKTIPAHFSVVAEASGDDVALIFGSEELNAATGRKHFFIGTPLDMQAPVCLDLKKFAERSSAVFGRTGTGKTFITRLLLAGFIHTDAAVNLVFDAHNEYGTKGTFEGEGQTHVKGLQPLFAHRGKVKVYSLDKEGTENRGARCDREVRLSIEQIEPEDILLLQEELRLNPTAAEYAHILKGAFGKRWLAEFMALMDSGDQALIGEFAEKRNLLVSSMQALWRRLNRLREQCRFLDFNPQEGKLDVIDDMIGDLLAGVSVVVEFGKYDDMTSYLLVANVITRRVEEAYKTRTENYLRTQNELDKPKQLVITIEEAHKFLSPRAASQTSFGKIARELRKYYVSLLLVDQRPSGIHDEILSQIGTKIVAALSDEKDINAVLSGVSNAGGMRSILASLDTKQQALIMGHAVPMPVVIRTRDYDQAFYEAMGHLEGEKRRAKAYADINKLYD
ncbi:MAG: ATP-binding protein [Chloroherpetonaceae bacterium]|nr:ATP-binding protein [Chloroherpetonaceae bacterium]MDW8437900.1 ATP-binding protein [Chloroherpetonaceae bacterium]